MSRTGDQMIAMLNDQQTTEALIEAAGLPLTLLDANFIWYWLRAGKTPAEIVTIALGHRRHRPQPDAHLGGIDA